jgi:hypothetical protein
MSIEILPAFSNQIQVYTRNKRVYVYFSFDPDVLREIKTMKRARYQPLLREWSFDEESSGDFIKAFEDRINQIDEGAVIWRLDTFIYFRFINQVDLAKLGADNLCYDSDKKVFVLPVHEYEKLQDFLTSNNIKAQQRERAQTMMFKRA